MFKEIIAAFKSKRTIVAVLSILFATVNAQLSEPLVSEELLNKLVVIVTGLIVGDSLRPVAKKETDSDG
jgi:hypothetical protein|tara:strand:+ start:303 stop:509 length:207 start_codon:yes stop_codon:yes gene_type:complete